MTFGVRCRNMIRTLLAPVTRADWMYGRSFRLRISDRMTRAVLGQARSAITRMMFQMLEPRTAARMMRSGNVGRTRMTSVKRMRTMSVPCKSVPQVYRLPDGYVPGGSGARYFPVDEIA